MIAARHVRRIGRVRGGKGTSDAEQGEERDGKRRAPTRRHVLSLYPLLEGISHGATVTLPIVVRAWMVGAYMSSTTPAGNTKVPVVTARTT